jgi:hypothetical protein
MISGSGAVMGYFEDVCLTVGTRRRIDNSCPADACVPRLLKIRAKKENNVADLDPQHDRNVVRRLGSYAPFWSMLRGQKPCHRLICQSDRLI